MDMNILIIDDSSVMRKILERSLRQAIPNGIEQVVEAGDGAEALAKLDAWSIQVIFSDINMPNMNGLDFLRNMKDTPHRDLPVIMVTTERGERTVMEAISLGAKGFIRKPFTPQQMESTLAKVMK